MANESFQSLCERVADQLNLEIIDTYDDGKGEDVVLDDGILHVSQGTTRVAFDVSENQRLNSKQERRNVDRVLTLLGRKGKI